MDRREKRRFLLFLSVMLAVLAGLWLFLDRFNESPISADITDEFLMETPFEEETARGTLSLGGKKYSWYNELEAYLFIGTDNSGNESAEGEEYRGNMADFLLVLILDRTENTYGLIQLNRDTMTKVTLMQKDGSGMASANIQLCTAHWYGGTREQSCENTVEAVSKLLGGIPIQGYYALNMEEIPALNHAVGGVTVTIPCDFSKADKDMTEGATLKLNDRQAYIFVHDRYNVGDETNVSRMERQAQYMKAFFTACIEKSRQEPEFVKRMYWELQDKAVTDISGKKVSVLYREISGGESKGSHIPDGELKKGKALGDGIPHMEFYIQEESLLEILTALCSLRQ